jgi:hypothetical protein
MPVQVLEEMSSTASIALGLRLVSGRSLLLPEVPVI